MRVGIGQINTTVGALEANADLVRSATEQACAQGASLVVFPELCLAGYPPRDLLYVESFVDALDRSLQKLADWIPSGVTVVVGTARRIRPRLGGKRLVNAAVVLRRGGVVLEVPKTLLPTYDVFDERRYFEPAEDGVQRVVEVDGVRVGLTVCEDLWNDRLLWGEGRRYRRDPVAEAVEEGAELIVNLSASPFTLGKGEQRVELVRHAARRWGRPVVFAAAVGANDGLIFDGASLVAGPGGDLVEVAPSFESAVRVVDLDRAGPVAHRPADPVAELASALQLGLQDYASKTGLHGCLLGLSGGIDSALVAALAALALGPAHVLGVAMPSRYSTEHSLRDARALAARLGIELLEVPIETVHAGYEQVLAPVMAQLGPVAGSDVTFENVQARVRGAILMAISNRTGRLLLTTGNKSECAVGYCTLYGDMCGGLAVIADLWKGQVQELCRWLNAHRLQGAIPESILVKAPSAELRPDQRDDQSLPPYEVLDPILQQLVEQEASVEQAAHATGESPALVRAIARKLFLAEYKRKQFAPTLKVSTRAWVGRDFPIAQRWRG